MTREDKDLLLYDLSTRLLYKTKCQIEVFSDKKSKLVQTVGILYSIEKLVDYYRAEFEYQHEFYDRIETRHSKIIIGGQLLIKPFLRPMSSMTNEERQEMLIYSNWPSKESGYNNSWMIMSSTELADMRAVQKVDWFNAHHFDYRGLIKKGLALEAPKDMYN